jgi:predicted flavoprotein YhiN
MAFRSTVLATLVGVSAPRLLLCCKTMPSLENKSKKKKIQLDSAPMPSLELLQCFLELQRENKRQKKEKCSRQNRKMLLGKQKFIKQKNWLRPGSNRRPSVC